jgi:hypothetical protein
VSSPSSIGLSASLASPLALAGCNPAISVAGAEFPVWTLCLLVGVTIALCLRPLFIAIGIDEWMAPRTVVYSSLALLVALLCWLLVWR